jgi:hypothetical protein
MKIETIIGFFTFGVLLCCPIFGLTIALTILEIVNPDYFYVVGAITIAYLSIAFPMIVLLTAFASTRSKK